MSLNPYSCGYRTGTAYIQMQLVLKLSVSILILVDIGLVLKKFVIMYIQFLSQSLFLWI